MQAVFKYDLDAVEKERILDFCNSMDYYSLDQSIGWSQLFPKTRFCYFYLYDDNGIKSFCQIIESHKVAQIDFGPVCCDKDLIIESVSKIIEYYKTKFFLFITIQLYQKSGYETDYIEYKLNKQFPIRYIFDSSNTKSSIEIDLNDEIEAIFRNFSKGHKSDIKKAQKLGLSVERLTDKSDLTAFNDIYSKMCSYKKIDKGELRSDRIFALENLLSTYNKGKILIAKDAAKKVVGGAIIVAQGNSIRYFKGASDPDLRNLPITHLLIFEAIKQAKNDGFRYFDFWGINHFAGKQDNIYYVNHFKKGFGGYYTFFAKKMNISLLPFGSVIFKGITFLKNNNFVIRFKR